MVVYKKYDKFSTFEEFNDAVSMRLDIVFGLYGVKYNISWENRKPYISICPKGDTSYFKDEDDLLDGYKINGKPLRDLWRDIEVYSM